MIELTRCDELIKQFEQLHKLKVHKVPLEYFDGRRVLLLMCKCSGVWTDLPFCSEGYVQTCEEEGAKYPFKFVESQDGNLFCSKNIKWQIRDTRVWSNNVYADKVNFRINIDNKSRCQTQNTQSTIVGNRNPTRQRRTSERPLQSIC